MTGTTLPNGRVNLDPCAVCGRPSDGLIASLWFSPNTVPVMAAALTADIGRHLIEEPDSEQGPIEVAWEADNDCVFLGFTKGRIYDYAGGPAMISLNIDEAHTLADALMRVSDVAESA